MSGEKVKITRSNDGEMKMREFRSLGGVNLWCLRCLKLAAVKRWISSTATPTNYTGPDPQICFPFN